MLWSRGDKDEINKGSKLVFTWARPLESRRGMDSDNNNSIMLWHSSRLCAEVNVFCWFNTEWHGT